MENIWQLYVIAGLYYIARPVFLIAVSIVLLRIAFRRDPPVWWRRVIVAGITAFWLVDLAPGTVGHWLRCELQAGIWVRTPVRGHPQIAVSERIEPSIAARFLAVAGTVEYELSPWQAERLGLDRGYHRFDAISTTRSACWIGTLWSRETIAACATVTRIDTPSARYLFDASERRQVEWQTGLGPPALAWLGEKDQTFVLDRETGRSVAAATLIARPTVSPLSGLLTLLPWQPVCPAGASREGLPLLLTPAAFPDLRSHSDG